MPSRIPKLNVLISLLVLIALCSCGRRGEETPQDSPEDEGWVDLFDGKTLEGWIPKIKGEPAGEDRSRTFRAQDGAIVVSYEGYEGFQGRFGHLFHRTSYENYDLEIDVRFFGEQCAGGPGWAWRNSGVMIHGQSPESMRVDQDFPVSIEVQFLGGRAEGERPTANLCTPGTHVEYEGALLKRHVTNSTAPTVRNDDWIRIRVEVRSDEIRHLVGDEIVLRYRNPQLDPADADAAKLATERAGIVRLTGGTISLQSESHPCAFRRIRLRPRP